MSHEVMSDLAWKKLLQALRKYEWNVYAKQPLGGAQQVLEYLSRYTHRVGISNERLLSMKNGQIQFKVREPIHPEKSALNKSLQNSLLTVSYCTFYHKDLSAYATMAYWPIATKKPS
jgi:hypothetical protein